MGQYRGCNCVRDGGSIKCLWLGTSTHSCELGRANRRWRLWQRGERASLFSHARRSCGTGVALFKGGWMIVRYKTLPPTWHSGADDPGVLADNSLGRPTCISTDTADRHSERDG